MSKRELEKAQRQFHKASIQRQGNSWRNNDLTKVLGRTIVCPKSNIELGNDYKILNSRPFGKDEKTYMRRPKPPKLLKTDQSAVKLLFMIENLTQNEATLLLSHHEAMMLEEASSSILFGEEKLVIETLPEHIPDDRFQNFSVTVRPDPVGLTFTIFVRGIVDVVEASTRHDTLFASPNPALRLTRGITTLPFLIVSR
ncbi:hypothetical protein E2542_SST05354 [Spatholobus suberectus]|nr:hypothetical protein E2542_SST05354 [Spatholobus suberectus]